MQLTSLQLDALREIGSIGNGHVSTCLSQLTDGKIIPTIPEVKIVPVNRLNEVIEDTEGLVVGISLRLLGEVMGKLLMIISYDNALSMLNDTLKERDTSITTISDADESWLKKIGQVITSTYIYALSNFLGILLVSYTPDIVIYKGKDFINWLIQELGLKDFHLRQHFILPRTDSSYLDSILCYQATFNKSPFLRFWGSFSLVFDLQTLRIILRAIDKLIKENKLSL
jgi:chemotaxis protein CheC